MHGRRLLLAEDDDDVRWALALMLRDLGWDVQELHHGGELLSAITGALFECELPPDAIVTDVRMPGLNGFNVIEGLRQLGWTTPVVMISAYADPDMRARAQKFVATDMLDKPVDALELDRRLKSMMS
jgi:CheY-like chemotaxis protein